MPKSAQQSVGQNVMVIAAQDVDVRSVTFVGLANVPTTLPSLPKSSLKIADQYSSSH